MTKTEVFFFSFLILALFGGCALSHHYNYKLKALDSRPCPCKEATLDADGNAPSL